MAGTMKEAFKLMKLELLHTPKLNNQPQVLGIITTDVVSSHSSEDIKNAEQSGTLVTVRPHFRIMARPMIKKRWNRPSWEYNPE